MPWQHIVDSWNEFFHAEMSCATLGLFRILLGLILVTNSILLLPLIDDYFSADGLWPIQDWQNYSISAAAMGIKSSHDQNCHVGNSA